MSVALKWVGRCATPRHATPCPVPACPGLATPLRWDVPGSMQSHEDVLPVAQRLQTAAVAELDPQPVAVARCRCPLPLAGILETENWNLAGHKQTQLDKRWATKL